MAPSTTTRTREGAKTTSVPAAAAAAAQPPSKKLKTEEGAWADVVKVEKNDDLSTPLQQKKSARKVKNDDDGGAGAGAVVPAVGGGALAVATAAASPYPDLKRPTVEECWFARDALAQLHSTFFAKYEQAGLDGGHAIGPGSVPSALLALPDADADAGGNGAAATVPATPEQPVRKSVLDSLVGTILSQNTTDTNSHRAFGILKARFPTWESVRVAKPRLVEDAVKSGGKANSLTHVCVAFFFFPLVNFAESDYLPVSNERRRRAEPTKYTTPQAWLRSRLHAYRSSSTPWCRRGERRAWSTFGTWTTR